MDAIAVEIVTTQQAAKLIGRTDARIRQLCIAGRIRGARKLGPVWMVPVQIRRGGRKWLEIAPPKRKPGRPPSRQSGQRRCRNTGAP